MSSSASISCADLAKALASTKPRVKIKQPCPVLIIFDSASKTLTIEEAQHGLFSTQIAAEGLGSFSAQVEGKAFGRLAATYPPASRIELSVGGEVLAVRCGRSLLKLARLDLGPTPTARKPMPVNKKHKGRVEPKPEGRHYAPKADTWLFSAQVPFSKEALELDDAENLRVSKRAGTPGGQK